jgi:hypothetical protein
MLPTIIYVILQEFESRNRTEKILRHYSTQYLLTIFKEKFKTDEYCNGQIYFFPIFKKKNNCRAEFFAPFNQG